VRAHQNIHISMFFLPVDDWQLMVAEAGFVQEPTIKKWV
jgi:hypothetical protein